MKMMMIVIVTFVSSRRHFGESFQDKFGPPGFMPFAPPPPLPNPSSFRSRRPHRRPPQSEGGKRVFLSSRRNKTKRGGSTPPPAASVFEPLRVIPSWEVRGISLSSSESGRPFCLTQGGGTAWVCHGGSTKAPSSGRLIFLVGEGPRRLRGGGISEGACFGSRGGHWRPRSSQFA